MFQNEVRDTSTSLTILRNDRLLFCLKRSLNFLTTSVPLTVHFLPVFFIDCTWSAFLYFFETLSMNRIEGISIRNMSIFFFTFFMQFQHQNTYCVYSCCKWRWKLKNLNSILNLDIVEWKSVVIWIHICFAKGNRLLLNHIISTFREKLFPLSFLNLTLKSK
jgi:hypothetical protein